MYLNPVHAKAASELLNSPLWADIKRCLMDRRPDAPEPIDKLRTMAAKGFERKGFELAIQEFEKLPYEVPPVGETAPFDRPAVMETAD